MTQFTYHASREQFTPSDLLRLVQRADQAGFDGAFTSDHAHPWSETQGQHQDAFIDMAVERMLPVLVN